VQTKRKRCSTVITRSLSKDLAVFIQAKVKKSTIKIYMRAKMWGGQTALLAPPLKKVGAPFVPLVLRSMAPPPGMGVSLTIFFSKGGPKLA